MKTKEKRILGFLAVVALAAVLSLLAGCSPAGKSVQDVIEDFIAAVNDRDASGVKDCLDEDAADYSTAATMDFWDVYFEDISNAPFDIATFSKSGDDATVTFSSDTGTSLTYYFEMTEATGSLFEGGTYYIRRIRQGSSTGAAIFE